MIFGMVGSAVSLYTRFGRRLLIEVLNNDEDAQVKVPSDDVIDVWMASFRH